MLILIFVLDIYFSLNFVSWRHVQRVGIHPRLPMGRYLPSTSLIILIEEKHQARLTGSVGTKYEEDLASSELKLIILVILCGKVQIERYMFVDFEMSLHNMSWISEIFKLSSSSSIGYSSSEHQHEGAICTGEDRLN